MPSNSQGKIQRLAIAIVGSGGSGVMTVGDLLLRAAAQAGWYGMMRRSSGPQIRGGEVAAYLEFSSKPIEYPGEHFDILLAIDWKNADRFAAEIGLDESSTVFSGESATELPKMVSTTGARVIEVDFKLLLKKLKGGRNNIAALGFLGALIGCPANMLQAEVDRKFSSKAMELEVSFAALQIGVDAVSDLNIDLKLSPPADSDEERWTITGNQAAGLGALRGGIRFVAAYPITPATEILEWMSPRLRKVGGYLLQAEDELASINMSIGASYSGVPSLTATSGPGLALMTESLGLAVAAEIPLVVVNVMRGGPSTGIPTKSEQTDLNLAVHGLHGDAPHLVLAPHSIPDCLWTTQWAVHLAEKLQTPAIVLSDQSLGQTLAVTTRPSDSEFKAEREVLTDVADNYERYALTDSGISPTTLPGTANGQYTADGLEHSPSGTPSSMVEDHDAQLEKRSRKLNNFHYGDDWAEISGNGKIGVITWGSTGGAVREAVQQLDPEGNLIRVMVIRLLSPAQPDLFKNALADTDRVLVVEQSYGAQFYRYLRGYFEMDDRAESFSKPGPLPISSRMLQNKLQDWIAA
ncbi:MAG: 2-oxoacid:acceptor oxidoreductase subunit alpha [SAR324 cluster bacterium]|nr:2-oxoacid:acceptor oxidoreductase subunit alpha [SAR324 cluster bacterium]